MENAQREVVSVLLRHVHSLGLVSKTTYSRAEDLADTVTDIPDCFRHPACRTGEASGRERAQGPK